MDESTALPQRSSGAPLSQTHWVAGFFALVFSLTAHYTALHHMPQLPVGKTPELEDYQRARSVTLRDVIRDPVSPLERPESFRAQDPTRPVDVPVEAASFLEALQAVLPDPQAGTLPAYAAADRALAEGGEIDRRTRWEPRQEILKIEEQRAARNPQAAPRRLVPALPSVPDAPDIAIPLDLPEVADFARVGPATVNADTVARMRGPLAFSSPGPVLPDVQFDPLPQAQGMPELLEAVDPLGESGEEAAPFEGVEASLTVDLVRFTPPDEPDVTYIRIDIQRKEGTRLPVLGRDVLIMQDCSESMTQRKLNACKEGLFAALKSLTPQDRFELLTFREDIELCFNRFEPADSPARAKAAFFIESMEARGKTDVYASLRTLAEMRRDPDRPFIAVLVTDGRPTTGLVDSSDIIEAFTQYNQGKVSVFCLGGGKRVNRFLLDLLSYRNRGDSKVEESRSRIPQALQELARELSRPVLMDLRYQFSGLDEGEVFPATLTHLYLDRPLVIYGRFRGESPRAGFQVVGRTSGEDKDMVFALDWDKATPGDAEIRRRWAWHKVYHLIGSYIETRREELLEEVHSLADQYNMPVPYKRNVVYR
jgi:uncharacterized protein YegL